MSQPPPQEIRVEGKAARIRGATWTQDQVKKLFDVWTQPDIYQGLLNEKKKLDIFKNMASILSSLGVNRTWRECRAKIKNLKADYRKAVEKKTPFRFYSQMEKIMNLDGSGSGTRTRTSLGGSLTIDSFFTRSRSSDSSTYAHDRQEPEIPTATQIGTPAFRHEIPSTSRSVIQYHDEGQTQGQGHHLSAGQDEEEDDGRSSSFSRFTPPPSTSKDSQYSSTSTTGHSPYKYQPDYHQGRDDDDDHTHAWRHFEETGADNLVEHDSSSRSSMVITHVVSNVIEPVTQIVMPSSSASVGGGGSSRSLPEETEIIHHESIEEEHLQQEAIPPPIRLEFLLENENIILQSPHSPVPDDVPDASSVSQTESSVETALPTSPIPTTVSTDTGQAPKSPSNILRQRLKQQKRPTSVSTASPFKPSLTSTPKPGPQSKRSSISTSTSPTKPAVESKKRKMLETLNRKTVETISDLLTETSQNLLKELQDAEQRFIQWEEEKRTEERKREAMMLSKLIEAMKSSPFLSSSSTTGHHSVQEETEQVEGTGTESSLMSNFSNMSKRINEMVCGEVKQTEESLRQWELKMQRQESRHTEKLFGMIINAIKTSSATTIEDD